MLIGFRLVDLEFWGFLSLGFKGLGLAWALEFRVWSCELAVRSASCQSNLGPGV